MSGVVPRQIRQLWITRFDCLAGCLPGAENPSDVDQVIEKNGHFLFLEFKRPYQTIPRGQAILFDRLLELNPEKVRLLLVVGQPPDEIITFRWWGKPYDAGEGVDALRALVRRWRDWAAAQ